MTLTKVLGVHRCLFFLVTPLQYPLFDAISSCSRVRVRIQANQRPRKPAIRLAGRPTQHLQGQRRQGECSVSPIQIATTVPGSGQIGRSCIYVGHRVLTCAAPYQVWLMGHVPPTPDLYFPECVSISTSKYVKFVPVFQVILTPTVFFSTTDTPRSRYDTRIPLSGICTE